MKESKRKRKKNIASFLGISRDSLKYGVKEKRILLYETLKGEKIYIQYPGKESTNKEPRPLDFRPELETVNGTFMQNITFGYIWDILDEIGRTHNGYLCLIAALIITACAEVRPPIRALVSIAKFTADKEMTILDFSKKQGYSKPLNIKDREYDIDTRKYISKVLSLFSVPVYNTEEYKITQKIISHYRKKGYYGVKYKSFYADGCNFTFFDEYINNFSWEDSRVVLNYATSNLFISLDQEEKCQDIDNIDNVKKEITSDLRNQMWKDIKNAWNFSLPIDEFKIAFSMHKSIVSGEHLTQKQLAEKENVDIKKVQLVQKKLKKAKKIKYVGVGKNGHWEWNDN